MDQNVWKALGYCLGALIGIAIVVTAVILFAFQIITGGWMFFVALVGLAMSGGFSVALEKLPKP